MGQFLSHRKNRYAVNATYESVNKLVLVERFEFSEASPVDVLGRGTFSAVFRGIDSGENRTVAVRRILYSTAVNKDLQELLTISHKNVARVHLIQLKSIYLYIITDYYKSDLKRFLFHRGPLRSQPLRQACKQLVDGYCALHAHHILHQNIKPQNIFVKFHPQGFTLKLAEFGLGCFLNATYAQGFSGTFLYMSPELGASAVLRRPSFFDATTDVWSLGLVFYELAVGSLPMDEEMVLRLFSAAANQESDGDRFRIRLSSIFSLELELLLTEMLEFERRRRLHPEDLFRHPFVDESKLTQTPDPTPEIIKESWLDYCKVS